jgi:hypothetical protein
MKILVRNITMVGEASLTYYELKFNIMKFEIDTFVEVDRILEHV